MKKLISVCFALTIIITAAAGLSEELINKFLNFSVKKVIAEEVFDKVWEEEVSWNMDRTFDSGYYTCRDKTYDVVGNAYNRDTYYQARTIIVARIKGHLHEGDNLKDLYVEIRPKFKSRFTALGEKEKENLQRRLFAMKVTFSKVISDKVFQKAYTKWATGQMKPEDEQYDEWLGQNLSAEKIAEMIKTQKFDQRDRWEIEKEVFKGFEDKDLAQFAGRRYLEGGEVLLGKYLEVINLALEDTGLIKPVR